MLIDQEMFDRIESYLQENGTIARFEQEQGPIKGRMMITLCDVPEEYLTTRIEGERVFGFEASFDFYDATAAFAFYPQSKTVGSGVWITPQEDGAEAPGRDWIEFFIHTVLDNIKDNGSFGIPMYTFLADVGDFTVVPISSEEVQDHD